MEKCALSHRPAVLLSRLNVTPVTAEFQPKALNDSLAQCALGTEFQAAEPIRKKPFYLGGYKYERNDTARNQDPGRLH